MIPIGLNLKDKNVLIVGGGKVALRKTKLFLKEGACVWVVSPTFLEAFSELKCTCISSCYEREYIKDKFLVYACTNDKGVNAKVVEDCNQQNILCGSATKDEKASFHSMAYEQNQVGMVALSTHQKMPYSRPILNELNEVLLSHETQLHELSEIRRLLVASGRVEKDYLVSLYTLDLPLVTFIKEALTHQKGTVFVYHQSDYRQNYSFDVIPSIVLSLKEFESVHSLLPSFVSIIPLLLFDGFIYRKLKQMTTLNVTTPLISKKEDIKEVVSYLRKEGRRNVWMLHPRNQNYLQEAFREIVAKEDIVQTFDDPLNLMEGDHIVVLLMSEGSHYHDLLNQLPKNVTVSKILPLEETIKTMIVEKK